MSHFIDTFRIGRFRGFNDVEFAGCGSTNLLIGVNNSGKSTVLEALAIYCRPFDMREWLAVLRRREARSGRGVHIDDLFWLFQRQSPMIGHDLPWSISLSAVGSYFIEKLDARAEQIRRLQSSRIQVGEDEYEDEGQYEEVGVAVHLDVSAPKTSYAADRRRLEFWPDGMFINEESPRFADVRSLTPFSHRIEPLQLKSLSEATQEGWKTEVLDLLCQIDPAILDLEILAPDGNNPALHVDYHGLGLAPIATLGDGIRRVISIALTVANQKGGLLLIDEIESAIHVSALKTVFPWLTAACRRNGVQLFATTHSLEALDALLESTPSDEMTCFRLDRPGAPQRVSRIAPGLLRRLRFDRGLDVR